MEKALSSVGRERLAQKKNEVTLQLWISQKCDKLGR